MKSSDTNKSFNGSESPKFSAANISENSINKITSLEQEISKESNEDVVLVAYSPNEPTR